MVNNKKIDFLVKQGYDRNVIDILIECGVERHLLWFLTINKKGFMKNLDSLEINIVNKYLEDCNDAVKYLASTKDKTQIYKEAVRQAYNFKNDSERKERNIIYRFENGYYISLLNEQDLQLEGKIMSNCVGGYYSTVENKDVGILALKHPSKKTVAHIEIKKNGQISQNFSKANSQIGVEYWKMILEFFEKNSKKVDFKNLFGDAYVTSSGGGYINSVSLCIPTSITYELKDGVKKINFNDAFELKRFSLDIPKNTEEIKFSEKSELTKWLQDKKNEILKVYDDLTEQINLTNSSDLYLSDEIKEKIFGSHKNSYLMKGEKYNLSEVNVQSVSAYGVPDMQEPEAERIDLEEINERNVVREDRVHMDDIAVVERIDIGNRVPHRRRVGMFAAPGVLHRDVEVEPMPQEEDMFTKEMEMIDCDDENTIEIIGNQPVEEAYPPNGPVANLARGVYENITVEEVENAVEIAIQEGDMIQVIDQGGHQEYIRLQAPPDFQELEMPPAPFEEILKRAR